ncbi:MAG: phage antirepressor Ant [Clostridiales bacterium]|nr:phage antirepressor Ant [Clostridiales bacterium]
MHEMITVNGIACYEQDGVAYLSLEACARGLGFTQVARSGNEVVRWERVNGYLQELGFVPTSGDGFIPENIFYRLAMKAKNETAERFQALVADEIIPAIRRHGLYMTPQIMDALLSDPDTMLRIVTSWNEDRKKLNAAQERIAADAPLVRFAQGVEGSETSVLIGTLAKLLRQNGVDIGEKRLFERLRREGFLCCVGERKNLPTQKAMELQLFEVTERTFSAPDGSTYIRPTTKVTGKGQVYFLNRYAPASGVPSTLRQA